MSDTLVWLTERLVDAPEQLRVRMIAAVEAAPQQREVHQQLVYAALHCLGRALEQAGERASAIDLLAADALLTHACEAASESGSDGLSDFAEQWHAQRFEQLLEARGQ